MTLHSKIIDTITADGPFQCPYCTGLFSVSNDETKDPAILHSLPTCKGYDDLETLEDAIRYIRAARGN